MQYSLMRMSTNNLKKNVRKIKMVNFNTFKKSTMNFEIFYKDIITLLFQIQQHMV